MEDAVAIQAEKKELFFNNRFFIWDTETTGLSVTDDDIISLGGVLCTYEGGAFRKIAEFHKFVFTARRIDPEAEKVHHISNSKLRSEPKFFEVINELRAFLIRHQPEPMARLIWLAHNGSKFDERILYCNFFNQQMDFEQFMFDVSTQ